MPPSLQTASSKLLDTTPEALIGKLRARWASLPDHRRPNPNMRYTLGDAALSAFAVFFVQSVMVNG